MSTLGAKIRTLRENQEWTQSQLADKLCVSPDTVQKWEVEKNTPTLSTIKEIAAVFHVPFITLADDELSVTEYWKLCTTTFRDWGRLTSPPDSEHTIYDADLRKGAKLHRFLNPEGESYSAIYIGSTELLSCSRDHEQDMVDYWNQSSI